METQESNEFVPKWLAWEITRQCNLNCVHCRASAARDASSGEFSTLEARKFIDELAGFCKPVLVLTGGEPLLRPDVFEIARHGAEQGLRMALATNGTFITEDVCRKIKDSGIRIVSLSLDGSSARIHDDFRRQPGAFASTLKAAGILRGQGIEFIVNSSFTRRNQQDIPAVFELAKEIGAQAWYMFLIVPTGRGQGIMDELVSAEDYEKILNWHYDAEKNESRVLMRPTCAPQYYRICMQRSQAEKKAFQRRSLSFSPGGGKGCVCAQSIAFVDAQGNLRPCSYFPTTAGNVKLQAFQDIWRFSEVMRSLRDFSAYKGKCGSCGYLRVCGGCRARAAVLADDFLESEPFCAYMPAGAGAG